MYHLSLIKIHFRRYFINIDYLYKIKSLKREIYTSFKDIIKKVVCIGDANAGKTAIITRFTKGMFSENYKATIGCDFSVKILKYGSNVIRMRLWDLGGDERFEYLRNIYYKGVEGAIILFDLTNSNTFDHLSKWTTELEQCGGNVPFIIGGNKADLKGARKIDQKAAEQFAHDHNALYFDTSAKDGSGVEEIFHKLTELMLEKK